MKHFLRRRGHGFVVRHAEPLTTSHFEELSVGWNSWLICISASASFGYLPLHPGFSWLCLQYVAGWHFCAMCAKSANYQCYTCPTAYCGNCVGQAEFCLLRKRRGLCEECLPIVSMIERNETVNNDGVHPDPALLRTYATRNCSKCRENVQWPIWFITSWSSISRNTNKLLTFVYFSTYRTNSEVLHLLG